MSLANSRNGEPGTVRQLRSVMTPFCQMNARNTCGPPRDRPTTWLFSFTPRASARMSPGSLPNRTKPPAWVQRKASKFRTVLSGRQRETHDGSLVIDRRRCVPGMSSEVRDFGRNAVLPENRVGGTDASDRDTTGPRDADDLAHVIDRRGGARGIAGKRRQFLHCAVRFPDDRSELQGLESGVACRVYDAVLRPTNDLATVVQRRGIAVEPARKRRKRGHGAVGPSKAITYFSGGAA